jgi:8-oxo-dGTP diphosphatase
MKRISVVAALIYQKDQVLIAKRSKGKLTGKWEFPGGKIESGETHFTAIEREISEELGWKVVANKEIMSFEHRYNFGLVHLVLIECKIINKRDNNCSDISHSEVMFCNPSIHPKITLAPLDRKIMDYLSARV